VDGEAAQLVGGGATRGAAPRPFDGGSFGDSRGQLGRRRPMADKVTARREAKTASIVAEAWALAREHGVGGVSLHALAGSVGMRQPSLYEYFDSKHALYDAMFADGNRQLLERLEGVKFPANPRTAVKKYLAAFVAFALEDPARYELLFQRHIPGFMPSPESYALAEDALGRLVKLLHQGGITDQGDIDCIVAITAGLMEAQMSNDPGGNRWTRHLNRLVDLYIDDATERKNR
jgi:AcrR family transcriptional regulator